MKKIHTTFSSADISPFRFTESVIPLHERRNIRKIVIDGNISAGKSTQLEMLKNKGFWVVPEPIEKWPLKDFYKNPKKWGFFFHLTMCQTFRAIKTENVVIYERSLMSARHVFWQILKEDGSITKQEDELYEKFYDDYIWYPDLYIYINKTPLQAMEHLKVRGQAGDSDVTLRLLRRLDRHYNNLIRNIPCRVIIINGDQTVDEIHKQIYQHLLNDQVFIPDCSKFKMQKPCCSRWQMFLSSCKFMCNMFGKYKEER